MAIKWRSMSTCETCGGDLIPIVYGLPIPKLIKDAENGLIHLGGCLLPGQKKAGEFIKDTYCRRCDSPSQEEEVA